MGVQGTGGSSAIANSWMQLRTAGAAARAMFVAAAADALEASRPASITVKDGVVAHAPPASRRPSASCADAAKVTPPQAPTLKDPKTSP